MAPATFNEAFHETFDQMLTRQVGNEFAASHQYIAVAVWFDSQDLPQLAKHFYRQALEERNHAMMIVRYILDRDLPLTIPAVGEVRNDFADVHEPLALALSQEQEVTEQIKALFAAARAENDALGEQFMLWFLKEQVEEVASMTTLVNIARRADNLFDLENFVAREHVGDGGHGRGHGSGAPEAAGGAV
ncbi:ferritin [Kocuria dechangensis]|uniref:Ferritin n=1 Tax=Kocuria dechangensis TaxID=1176249 RepID=A0A917LPG9_9MICC|nr:ferritin [Kocuria dechangensis]GGG49634.1 ferritin [Kocuria dechangensis]